MSNIKVGIIGGSGLYSIKEITDIEEVKIETPFGETSDNYIIGTLGGKRVAFLPRHGRGHRFLPHEINYRANIYGFKKLGVREIISVSSVGSLKEEHAPLDIILPDQFVDITKMRKSTFFGNGISAHVQFSHPTCPQLTSYVKKAADSLEIPVKVGGTYICMEGPQFSTKAESNMYRTFNFDVIGMSNATEAKLAREAEICYVTIAFVTDYDCWFESEEEVSVDLVIRNLQKNIENAKKIIKEVVNLLPEERDCKCHHALENAIMTDKSLIPPKIKKDLDVIIGKYIE